ncbi:MAG: efflux RND transporter periplasmic adaptor subunit [Gudongella sp.]|nr:efflux RND transporter periplasmic adaptor subunit [Gudongella sp.]
MKHSIKGKFLIVILLLTIILSSCSTANVEEAKKEYTPVEILTTKLTSLEKTVTLNGRLVANEEVSIIPKASGTVASVNVSLGDLVEEGDVLFTIEPGDYERNVDQALASVQMAQKSVDQASNGLNTAKINYELNKEKIESAILNLERTKILYEEGAVSKSQLEQAEISANALNLDAIKAQVNQAEIAYNQSLSQLEQARVGYDQAKSGVENTIVKSPIKGTISSLNVIKGQIAASSQIAASVVEVDRVYIQVSVVENIVTKLSKGQRAYVRVSSVSDDFAQSTVEYVSTSADPRTQLYTVRIYLDNPDKSIRPGMIGEVKLTLERVESAVVVKSDAILENNGENYVFVEKDGFALKKIVQTGLDAGEMTEIKAGLEAGEALIIEGQHYISNGTQVKVVRGE